MKKCKISKKSFALLFFVYIFAVPNKNNRGVAQLVSESGLGPEGPVFESQYPDIRKADLRIGLFLLSLHKTKDDDTGKRHKKVFRSA